MVASESAWPDTEVGPARADQQWSRAVVLLPRAAAVCWVWGVGGFWGGVGVPGGFGILFALFGLSASVAERCKKQEYLAKNGYIYTGISLDCETVTF